MKKHINRLYQIFFFVVFLALGLFLGYSISHTFGSNLPLWHLALLILSGVLIMFISAFMQIILHELGHMLAALIRGWHFTSFMVLGMVLTRREGHFHVSRFSILGAGGQCLMSPPENGDTDFGISFYNAGGVLMNIIVSLLAAIIYFSFPDNLIWPVSVFLCSFAVIGLSFALTNGIPMMLGGLPNDGKNIRDLRKDKFSTNVFLTSMQVMSDMQNNKAIDEIMSDYMCKGHEIDYSNPIHQMALSQDVSRAVCVLDFDHAKNLLQKIDDHKDDIAGIYLNELKMEKIFVYLVAPDNNVDVGVLMDKDIKKYIELQCSFRPSALRVKYAYTLIYDKDADSTGRIYDQFMKVSDKYHVRGEVICEKKLVEYARTLGSKNA